jgi:CubicO group peptidase (beta-lactamase class C family)
MKDVLHILIVLALCLAPVTLSGSESTASGRMDIYEPARDIARTMVGNDITAGKASSASVAIMAGAWVVYSEGMGLADRESGTPATAETIFNIGSCSKTFAAAALMKLVDEGKVQLDEPVTEYLPELKMKDPRYTDITVRMLLNHSSGFPGSTYANNMGYAFNPQVYEDTLANLAGSNLKTAPGQTAPYCNDGFTLAEMIVTRVTGEEDFMAAVRSLVLDPLSLDLTGPSVGQRPHDSIARSYQAGTGKITPPETLSFIGAGGISSTAGELVRFMDSFAAGGHHILTDASIAEMMEPSPSVFARAALQETGINPEMNYGLGLDLTSVSRYQAKGIRVVGKGGDTDDYHAMMLLVPGERISVAVIEAGHDCSPVTIAYSMLDRVLKAKGFMTPAPTPAPLPTPAPQPIPSSYASYTGVYGPGFKLAVDFDHNVVELTSLVHGRSFLPQTMTYNDGNLYMADGTAFKMMSAAGRDMIIIPVDGGYMTFGQKLATLDQPQSIEPGIDGVKWLRRNVKPWEGIVLAWNSVVESRTFPEAPGYIDFKGIKKVTSSSTAGMATDALRDITELTMFGNDGSKWVWARASDCVYSRADTTPSALGAGSTSVTIGQEGYNEWLWAAQTRVITVRKPSDGRIIVFAPDDFSVSYDSEIDSGQALVRPGGLVQLAGNPGETFMVGAPLVIDSGDYNGDGLADIAVFRPENGIWAVRGLGRTYFGRMGDVPVSGDYDGDRFTDIAVFRPESGLWEVKNLTRFYFGGAADIPVPGDYAGDGTARPGVFQPASGLWAVRGLTRAYFGRSEDLPVPGDYAGDGVKDLAVFRPSSGLWAVRGLTRAYFGRAGDCPVPGAYRWYASGKTAPPFRDEIAIFRPLSGLWAIRGGSRFYFGQILDIPIRGDFDGNSLDGAAIFRPETGLWAIRGVTRAYFGSGGDIPVTR